MNSFNPEYDKGYKLDIINITGKVIKSINLKSNRVDISQLQSGIYIVNIMKDSKNLLRTKLVVNK